MYSKRFSRLLAPAFALALSGVAFAAADTSPAADLGASPKSVGDSGGQYPTDEPSTGDRGASSQDKARQGESRGARRPSSSSSSSRSGTGDSGRSTGESDDCP